MAFKGEGKRCKENTIDDTLDDEWNYDFENGIDSDEEHVDSIQWCATFSSHGVGLDVGLNHGGDLDANLDHGISGFEVGFFHGINDLDATFDGGDAFDDSFVHNDGDVFYDGVIALDHGLDHGDAPDDGLNHGVAIEDGLDHGVTNPSKSKGNLWNINNPKLLVPNLELIITNLNPSLSPHKILGKTLANINFDLDNESILRLSTIFFATLNAPSMSISFQVFKHAPVLKPCKQKNP